MNFLTNSLTQAQRNESITLQKTHEEINFRTKKISCYNN